MLRVPVKVLVSLFCVVILASATLQAAGASLSSIFRTDQSQTGTINPADFEKISEAMQGKLKIVDIVNFGQLRFLSWPARRRLKDTDLATFPDFTVKTPPLEFPGYKRKSLERVATTKVRFALRIKHINKLLASLGTTALLPDALDGKPFVLTAPPQVMATYSGQQGVLVLIQTLEPDLDVPSGIDLAVVRDALLSLPGFPQGLRSQLAGVDDWRQSQIAPFGGGATTDVRVNGQPAVWVEPHSRREGEPQIAPQVKSLHRELEESVPGGEQASAPMGHMFRANSLTWRQDGVIFILQGDIPLDKARSFAEMIK